MGMLYMPGSAYFTNIHCIYMYVTELKVAVLMDRMNWPFAVYVCSKSVFG